MQQASIKLAVTLGSLRRLVRHDRARQGVRASREKIPDIMKILHLIDSLDPLEGGKVECVRQIGAEMSAMGHGVEVAVCADIASAPWIKAFPMTVHALGPGTGKYAYSPRFREWLMSNGSHYDCFVVNGLWQYQGYCGSRVAIHLGIPYYVYPHGMLDPWSRRANPLKYLKKVAYWMAAERFTLKNAAGLVFTSEDECRLAPRYFPRSRWRSIVVGHGVSEPPRVEKSAITSFRIKYSIPGDRPIWLFLSRVHPKKGIENLLAVLPRLMKKANAPFVLIAGAGDANYVEQLKAKTAALGLEGSVIWTGPLYGDEKWAAFGCAELFILPSHQENFGIVIAEALSMGLPVCTTRQVNIWREIDRCGAGLICSDTETDLQAELEKWLLLKSDERQNFRVRARRCFEEYFQISGAATRLAAAMKETSHR